MQPLSQSSLKQQISQLQHEIDEYRVLFDTVPVKIWFKDTANRVMKINKPAADLEGKPVEEIEGKSCYQLYPKDIAEAYYQHDLQVIQSGDPVLNVIEPHVIPSTGETAWMETGKVPYYGKSTNVSGVIAFAVDITEKQQIQQELDDLRQNVAKSTDKLVRMVENGEDPSAILEQLQTLKASLSEKDKSYG